MRLANSGTNSQTGHFARSYQSSLDEGVVGELARTREIQLDAIRVSAEIEILGKELGPGSSDRPPILNRLLDKLLCRSFDNVLQHLLVEGGGWH